MKRYVLTVTMLCAIAIAALPSADAQSCQIPSVITDLVKKLKEECKKVDPTAENTSKCTENRQKFLQLVEKWNTLVGNSSLRLGPRDMEWNTDQNGTLVAPGDRRFVSQLIEKGKGVTITVTKKEPVVGPKDTKGGCVVSICAVDLDTGAETNLATHTFENGAKAGTSMTKTFSASQAGNKILVVKLDGKGSVGDRFPYTFRPTKN